VAVAGSLPPVRRAVLRTFADADGAAIDSGLMLYFPGPRSFTGEDVLELQGHGGPVVLQLLLGRILGLGARLARPGEFTERAFLNGKLDLAQAEAVADLIASGSEAAARGALRSLSGEFSRRVQSIEAELVLLRTYVEAAIDFSDQDIDVLSDYELPTRISEAARAIATLREDSAQGVMLRDGISIALVGEPNVGKSSLLNRLAGEDKAIVTEVPGTTRDLVSVPLNIGGLPVEVVDTAGLRETEDPVELEGVRRARRQAELADVVLWVTDSVAGEIAPTVTLEQIGSARLIRVVNKIDLTGLPPGRSVGSGAASEVRVSARTGAGMDALTEVVQEKVGFRAPETAFTARRRHLLALDRALDALERARAYGAGEEELMAEELRLSHLALGEIVGEMTPDDLLGEIFASFCIGK